MFINKNKIFLIILLIVFFILALSFYNAIILGASWDEFFHHINGNVRLKYLYSFGKDQSFNNLNQDFKYYPGFYDSLASFVFFLINNISQEFSFNYLFEIKHLINLHFSILSILGMYLLLCLLTKDKLFAIIVVALTLLNPTFFGHLSFNPKDPMIFFSLIWFMYFFYLYVLNKKSFKYLIYFSFFVAFGAGIRLSFFAIIFPIVIIGIFFFKIKNNLSFKELFYLKWFDVLISLFVIFFLIIIFWPHSHSLKFSLIIDVVLNSINWNAGPALMLINGFFHETKNTPSNYFLLMLLYKIPIYQTLLFLISIYITIKKKNEFSKNIYNLIKFSIFLIFYCVAIAIILKVKIYDDLRQFIFLIPFFCVVSSLSIYIFVMTYEKKVAHLLTFFIVFIFFSLSLNRFILSNPYQYTYINYSYFNLKSAEKKFENDYWNASFKELIDLLNDENIKNVKIGVCGGDNLSTAYYFFKKYKKKIVTSKDFDYVIMTNRVSFNSDIHKTCYDIYKIKTLFEVKRNNVVLSKFGKIIR